MASQKATLKYKAFLVKSELIRPKMTILWNQHLWYLKNDWSQWGTHMHANTQLFLVRSVQAEFLIHENSDFEPSVCDMNGLVWEAAVAVTTDQNLHLDDVVKCLTRKEKVRLICKLYHFSDTTAILKLPQMFSFDCCDTKCSFISYSARSK